MENRITPDFITSLKENEIFVFGCRRSGRHWEGAAAFALKNFGAIFGQGEGSQGRSYALATAGIGLADDVVDCSAEYERHYTRYSTFHGGHRLAEKDIKFTLLYEIGQFREIPKLVVDNSIDPLWKRFCHEQ